MKRTALARQRREGCQAWSRIERDLNGHRRHAVIEPMTHPKLDLHRAHDRGHRWRAGERTNFRILRRPARPRRRFPTGKKFTAPAGPQHTSVAGGSPAREITHSALCKISASYTTVRP